MGVSSVVGSTGSIVAPLLLTFKQTVPWLPGTVDCLVATAGAVVTMRLPETTGVDMMSTVGEAEYFYEHGRYLSVFKINFIFQKDLLNFLRF